MPILEQSVSNKRTAGRPAAFEVGTRQVKLAEDLVQMMQWIIRLEGGTLAQLIDPLARPEVVKRYSKRYAEILAIKMAEDAAKSEPGPPLPPPSEYTTPVVTDFVFGDPTPSEIAAAKTIVEMLGPLNPVTLERDHSRFDQLSAEEKQRLAEALESETKSLKEINRKLNEAIIARGQLLATIYPPVEETEPSAPPKSRRKPKL